MHFFRANRVYRKLCNHAAEMAAAALVNSAFMDTLPNILLGASVGLNAKFKRDPFHALT